MVRTSMVVALATSGLLALGSTAQAAAGASSGNGLRPIGAFTCYSSGGSTAQSPAAGGKAAGEAVVQQVSGPKAKRRAGRKKTAQ